MAVLPIAGLEEILKRFKEHREKLGAGFSRGVRVAGLRLQRESQRLVPVDYGVLKNSAFTRASGEGLATEVTVGYTAAYAIYVHENVEMKLKGKPRPGGRGKYWDPQGRGQSKFLEEPMRRLAPELRQTILDNMKIK